MKFKRLLAAILSALMITSCMSFVAGAQEAEAEADIEAIEEVVIEEAEEEAEEEEAPAQEATDEVAVEPEEEEATEEAAAEPETEAESEEAPTEEEPEEAVEEAALAEETSEETTEETPEEDTTEETVETGVLKEFVISKNSALNPSIQNGSKVKLYDAEGNLAFIRITPSAGDVSTYVNHGGADVNFTTAQANADANYLVYYARTNLDMDAETEGVQMPAPTVMQYDSTWDPTTTSSPHLVQVTDGFASTATDEWQKFCFKITSKFTSSETEYLLTKWNQIAIAPLGLKTAGMSGDVMYSLSDNPYIDVAGYTVVGSLEAAQAYDFAVEAELADVTTTFDLNYTGAPAIEGVPTEAPAREGIAFHGWSTDKNAASGETDLTALTAIPTEDTTYYAIWDNAAVTFNRRNGASHVEKINGSNVRLNDTISTVNVGVGEVIPFPDDPTYMSHTFLGWSTEKNNAEAIIEDTSNIVVTSDMVESGITYYAVWKSTHDSTQPLFLVTAQKNGAIMAAEYGSGSILYDDEKDIVYKHFVQNSTTSGVRCNMYGLTNAKLAYTTDVDELYFVYYLRTNVTGYKPYVNFNSTTNKDGSVPGTFHQKAEKLNYTVTNAGETPDWQKITLNFSGMSELGIAEHMDFSPVGKNAVLDDGEYFDVSVIAIFDNAAAAESFDPAAASQVDRVTVSYDTYGGNETYDSVQVKSGTYSTDLVPFPEANPTKENYTFVGWAAAKHGTVLDTTAVTVPKADTTYYAVWTMAESVVEAENAVYVDAVNGCDTCNDGRSAKYPFATLDKAIAAVKTAGIDTIYIIGTYETGKDYETFGKGTANSKLYIKGYTGKDTDTLRFVKLNSKNETVGSQFRLDVDTEIDNISLYRASNDGGIMLKGKNLTIGSNVASSGYMYISQQYYSDASADNSILNVNSGKWNKLQHGIFTGATFTGNFTINLGGTAEATQLDAGHGNGGSNQVFQGMFTLNMSDSAKIGTVQLQSTGGGSTPFNKLYGARIYNLNGGKISTLYTTPNSRDGQVVEGVTVIHVNKKDTVDKIAKGSKDANTARVVVFNDIAPIDVSDSAAAVIHVYGGKLTANVSVDSANSYAATINHYDIEVADEAADMVNITDVDGNVTTKAISELEGKLSADLFKAGVNKVDFYKSIDIEEPAHIAAYREAGHNIVYVRRLATGKADGSDYINTVGYKNDMSAYTEAGKTTVFVFVDKINIVNFGVAQGSTAVITEYTDDGIFYFEGSVALTPTCSSASVVPANFIFDNIHILHKNGSATGERIINASGNNLTFTETVTNDSSTFPGEAPLNIHAASDNVNLFQNSLGKMTLTFNGGSRLSVRAGGWGGSQITGDVEFNVGGNAHVSSLNLGGHCDNPKLTETQRTITGNVAANIGGNATVDAVSLTNQGIVTGNATINITGGTVTNIKPTTGAKGAVNGDVIINVTGGTLGNIAAKSASVAGDIKAEIDLDNAKLTGTVDTSAFYAIAHKGEGEYAVKVDAETGAKTLALTFDNTKIKYVRIINGENVKSYTVAGDEVTLLADVDFSAIPLEGGLTSVEFLEDATETKLITWVSDGETVKTEYVAVGTVPTAPELTKTGHTLTGWDKEIVAVTEATTYTAVWEANKHNVIYTLDGAEYDKTEVAYGTEVTILAAPEAKEGYTFSGWSVTEAFTMPDEDVTITGTYILNNYTITFDAGEGAFSDGEKIKTVTADHGVTPEFTEVPVLADHTFAGWEPTVDVATKTATYTAKWTVNKATATFDANGGAWGEETTKTAEVDIGAVPTAPEEDPVKAGHTFAGWTPEFTAITAQGATYTAQWTVNKHNVIYTLDGVEYSNTEVEYGETVEILAAPEAREGYTFSGWSKAEAFTMPDEDVTITGAFTANNYTVTYKVDGEVYGDVDTYAYGAAVTMREAPTKDGYTFSGWDKTLTTMPAENVEINGTFTEDEEPFPTSATYKTYGYYDVLGGTYKVEVKFSGAKVNRGSFGFTFPEDQMTFKSVAANAEAGIELLGTSSPIYANADGNYADTWVVSAEGFAGHIDATAEEVLVATFTFTMSEEQRAAFEAGTLAEGKFSEYVVASPDAKYHNGENYLATPYATDFTLDTAAITYASHTDEETAPEITYTTYGTYDEYNGTYSIDIKVKGAKINLGAFGLAFNEEYMTFDPANEGSVVFADHIANYLGITLHNAADGYAFAFDGSSMEDGYIDASTEEVLIATLNLKMTSEQRAAFEAAGKTMSILVPTTSDTIDEATLAKYFDGENYLVSIYVSGLATPKLPAEYIKHNDEVIEATVADVEVEVTFASKDGATVANIAQIRIDDGEAVAIEEAGNTEETLTYTFEALEIGKTYTVTVEKNGYLAGVAEIEVVKGENTIEMTLLAGDIKGKETANCGDGKVDLSDFVRVIRAFDTAASADFKSTVDLDESGLVNVTDLSILKTNYNKTSDDNTVTINGQK